MKMTIEEHQVVLKMMKTDMGSMMNDGLTKDQMWAKVSELGQQHYLDKARDEIGCNDPWSGLKVMANV